MNTRLFLLGLPNIEVDGVSVNVARRKVLGLIAYLARHERTHSREALAALFWPELDQSRSLAALRRALTDLRNIVPPDALIISRQRIALRPTDNFWVDAKAFDEYIRLGREQATPELINSLVRAVELYRGDFMGEFTLSASAEFDHWQAVESQSLRLKFANTLRQLVEIHSERSEYKQAITYALRHLILDSLDEARHRTLMRLYVYDKQISAALRQYQACAKILDEELGIEPSVETDVLYAQIRNNSMVPASAEHVVTSVLPPLPALLIGRENVRDDLYHLLQKPHGVIAIQGWPGVGKSTIAALLAHDPAIRTLYPDGVLWVSLGENPNPFVELTNWAKALNIPVNSYVVQPQELSSKIAAALHDKQVLIIVDDVWQVAHANLFKVHSYKSALVATTRFNDVARDLASSPNNVYKLGVLEETSGLELLKVLAPQVVASYPTQAVELVNDLEGLPLAIEVAGRLLHTESQLGWSIVELLNELREGEALMRADAPVGMIGLTNETRPTVAMLLRKSTDRLDSTTAMRFGYLSLFAPKPATFDLEAMSAVWSVSDPRPTIRTLVDRGLLDPLPNKRFQMHALLVMHARTVFSFRKG